MGKFFSESFNIWSLLYGITFWNFFATATVYSIPAFQLEEPLLINSRLSPLELIASKVNSVFITFLAEIFIISLLEIIFYQELNILIYFKTLMLDLVRIYILTLITSLALAYFYRVFRLLGSIWTAVVKMIFFLTPVFYPLNILPEYGLKIILLNPISWIVISVRDIQSVDLSIYLSYKYFFDISYIFVTILLLFLYFNPRILKKRLYA